LEPLHLATCFREPVRKADPRPSERRHPGETHFPIKCLRGREPAGRGPRACGSQRMREGAACPPVRKPGPNGLRFDPFSRPGRPENEAPNRRR